MINLVPVALLRCVAGGIGLVAVGMGELLTCVGLLIAYPSEPIFDVTHPDYTQFAGRFAEARETLASGMDKVTLDLSSLNGGVWTTACLFGGFTRPMERMDALGASVDRRDRKRLGSALGWRAAPVEEYEIVIAFVDERHHAHFIHFPHGVGAEGQHYRACVTQPQTTLEIGSWSGVGPI